MSETPEVDYGPLTHLIGTWTGAEGVDLAPEPDGAETSPYFETLVFTAIGDVTNAEAQTLAVVHYRQIVHRKSTGEVFHDETGYWLWDAATGTVMQSFTIPRGVALVAGGSHGGETDADGRTVIRVRAGLDDPDWRIVQSPFMRDNATTTEFRHEIIVGADSLDYSETTMVDIYGRSFEHTDRNRLRRARQA